MTGSSEHSVSMWKLTEGHLNKIIKKVFRLEETGGYILELNSWNNAEQIDKHGETVLL
jgi:hypothetical protein